MANEATNIIKHPLQTNGQAQSNKMPNRLKPDEILIDDRTREQLLNYLKSISGEVLFYNHIQTKTINGELVTTLNFAQLFESLSAANIDAAMLTGNTQPHFALLDVLVKLYEHPKKLLNSLTGVHLNNYYNNILGLQINGPKPDTLHACFELKKNASNTLLKTGAIVTGAKDALGNNLEYALQHDVIVSKATVAEIKSLQVNENTLRFAAITNSEDGLGAELPADNLKYNAFANDTWPLAEIGFAIAAPVLRLAAGKREIKVTFTCNNLIAGITEKKLENSFTVSLTGAKGWITKGNVSPKITSGTLTGNGLNEFSFSIKLTEKDDAIIDFNNEIHQKPYMHTMPVIQLIVNNLKTDLGYTFWKKGLLENAEIEVTVEDIKDQLIIETDFGAIDAKKPFMPFGPQAQAKSICSIDYPEAFAKNLMQVSLDIEWKNVPAANLASYYEEYGISSNASFKAITTFNDNGKWNLAESVSLFDTVNAKAERNIVFNNPQYKSVEVEIVEVLQPASPYLKSNRGQTVMSKMMGIQYYSAAPLFSTLDRHVKRVSDVRRRIKLISRKNSSNKLVMQLNRGFLFNEYRTKLTSTLANFSKGTGTTINLPSEPFSPEIKSVIFNYKATSGQISFDKSNLFLNLAQAIHVYHIGPFGVRNEEPTLLKHITFLNNSRISLLPQFNNQGECYIGINNSNAEEEITLLLQMAEGSANPDRERVSVAWHVLSNNYWKRLGDENIIFDCSEQLITSGVIKIILPTNTTENNSWMPEGLIWLRMSIIKDTDAVCNFVEIKTNAAIALLQSNGIDAAHFGSTLTAGSINILK